MKNKHDLIVVLDFGAQYAMLIARRIRECNIYCEVLPHNTAVSELISRNAKGIILSGGPSSVYDDGAPLPDPELLKSGIPILGICYGMQLIGKELGGEVKPGTVKEYGKTQLIIDDQSNLFAGLQAEIQTWMSHGDSVVKLPEGFQTLGHTSNTTNAAIGDHERKIYGVQFHPEVVHTPDGLEIIKNFVYVVCGCKPTWTTKSFAETATAELKEILGQEKILCALSGGVDSTTVAALVHKAVGEQLTCMFIDQGFMRKNEAKKISELFTSKFKINFILRIS